MTSRDLESLATFRREPSRRMQIARHFFRYVRFVVESDAISSVRLLHHWQVTLTLAASLALLGGCTTYDYSGIDPRTIELRETPLDRQYHLGPADELSVRFFHYAELNDELTIRPDGQASLQLVGDMRMAGLTVDQLRQAINARYAGIIKAPDVTVNLRRAANQKIFIGGEVANPGMYEITRGISPMQALLLAGGAKSSAELESVLVFRDLGEPVLDYYIMDLQSPLKDPVDNAPIQLYARDVLFVPPSRIASINTFMEHYVHKIIPLMATFGFSYIYQNNIN